jgi:hypothetical protein
MAILTASLLFGRPDTGLVLVAWWTIVSLIFHAVRLAQASERAARGQPVLSWLEAGNIPPSCSPDRDPGAMPSRKRMARI